MIKNIQCILTDMDGSLLDSNRVLPENIHSVIDLLKDKNILFGICSGRQYYTIYNNLSERDDILYIGENGGFSVYNQEILYFNAFDKSAVHEFLKISKQIKNCYPVLCGKKSAYTEARNPEALELIAEYYKRLEIVDDLSEIDDEFCKITFLDYNGSEQNSYNFYKHLSDRYEVIIAAEIWLDICAKGQSKGDTLTKVAKKLNINLNNTVAFGDYLNDTELLEVVGHGFAMENAHPDLKKIANYIAPSNDENGVIKTILDIINVKEL